MTPHSTQQHECLLRDAERRVIDAAKQHVAYCYTHTAAALKLRVRELLAIEAEAGKVEVQR